MSQLKFPLDKASQAVIDKTVQKFLPIRRKSRTWATTGNTDSVTDSDVKSDSVILIMHTSLPMGRWYVTVSAGSFVVTSSDTEAAATTYDYIIIYKRQFLT